MSGYQQWVNSKEPGVYPVHRHHRPEIRDARVFHIARESKIARATLHGYVVMPHHIQSW